MDIIRTDEARFHDLPDWPYRARYLDDLVGYQGLRLHYIDEGPKEATHTYLCLHGEPSRAYLYRKMIPFMLASGARVVAPDFFGFGRSDKPVDDGIYTWDFHRQTLVRFIERLNLSSLTLVVQDWGGLLGLTLPVSCPERITRLLIMNTTFAIGATPSPGFLAWRDYVAKSPDLKVGALMKRSTPHLSEAEIAAYDAPFPDQKAKAGVRRFPQLVPIEPTMTGAEISRAARDWWREKFEGPSFMAIGMADPVLGPNVMQAVRHHIRGCPPPLEILEGGHFVQEWGELIMPAALHAWSKGR